MEKDNVLNALIELRKSLRASLTEEERKIADKHEAENGAKTIIKEMENMETATICLIMKSLVDKNPKIILDITGFVNMIEKMYDVFGTDTTSKMLAEAMSEIKNILDKRFEEEGFVGKKLKEMNGEPEEYKKEVLPEIEEIRKFLNDKGFDIEIERVTVEEDD